MLPLANQFDHWDQIPRELAIVLDSTPELADVLVLNLEDDEILTAEVATTSTSTGKPASDKCGLAICIMLLKDGIEPCDSDMQLLKARLSLVVLEDKILNRGAKGTGIHAKTAANYLLSKFHEWIIPGLMVDCLLADESRPIEDLKIRRPGDASKGEWSQCIGCAVNFTFTFLNDRLAKTPPPVRILANGPLTLAPGVKNIQIQITPPVDYATGDGTAIHYTLDGSHPGTANPQNQTLDPETPNFTTLVEPGGILTIRVSSTRPDHHQSPAIVAKYQLSLDGATITQLLP